MFEYMYNICNTSEQNSVVVGSNPTQANFLLLFFKQKTKRFELIQWFLLFFASVISFGFEKNMEQNKISLNNTLWDFHTLRFLGY